MKMKTPIILCFLLAYAACAESGHFQDEGLSEMEEDMKEMEEEMEEIEEMALQTEGKSMQKIPGVCFFCKFVMREVKALVPFPSKPKLAGALHKACRAVRLGRRICRRVVAKHLAGLVHELWVGHGPRLACKILHLCWWGPLHGPE